jgi:hypothetical protein
MIRFIAGYAITSTFPNVPLPADAVVRPVMKTVTVSVASIRIPAVFPVPSAVPATTVFAIAMVV